MRLLLGALLTLLSPLAPAISVVVQSVEGGPARISHRAKQPMNPA